ncbi:unnamed protein product [Euphydryas editha]|uniref:Uncharacterized protein n=1 Tax=Euphydryas editha TaxID=104508 RepID=A0AAU9UIF1_EUPED|nr:unnamed protein product [Euphydryas editha]CAH2098926.1 unnamed protein product [Euphydryas editha]CAH2098927.1 unnamed protein product [Euphydryas editha]CAH2098928.1 unnamed protein product [Euphydryas editha]CAH2098929.1 unnamed protein product [Euphydryas editha]
MYCVAGAGRAAGRRRRHRAPRAARRRRRTARRAARGECCRVCTVSRALAVLPVAAGGTARPALRVAAGGQHAVLLVVSAVVYVLCRGRWPCCRSPPAAPRAPRCASPPADSTPCCSW